MKYRVEFYGRPKGAKSFYTIVDKVEAEDEASALLKLRERYDSIRRPKFTPAPHRSVFMMTSGFQKMKAPKW